MQDRMQTTLDTLSRDDEFRREFAEESFVLDCLEKVCAWMEREGVSRAELAKRLGTSRANVTQMLRGRNVSLRTIAGVAYVLGGVPTFEIVVAPHTSAGSKS